MMPITNLTGVIADTVVFLPAEDVQRSSGLALDIGSTVGKIVYRSNKEYKSGKSINQQDDPSQGTVHYAMFPRADVMGMINYIKDNCDLTPNDSGEVVVNSSGVGGAAFRTQIETGLKCKVEILPEFDCFCQAFIALEKMTPAEKLLIPLSPENQAMLDAEKEKHEARFGEAVKKIKSQSQMDFNALAAGQADLKDEDRPRLLMMAGSASAVMQINRDGTFSMSDGVVTGGRFMYGLACILTGENDFDKLVEMAESSDGKTVDTTIIDLVGDQSAIKTDNVYGSMVQKDDKDDRRCMPFGKGVNTPTGKMKKGDLAYSVFNTAVEIHGQLIRSCVKQSKAREVYVCGNVFNTEFMRLQLCRFQALQKNRLISPELQYDIKFLRNGGMYGALGAFMTTE